MKASHDHHRWAVVTSTLLAAVLLAPAVVTGAGIGATTAVVSPTVATAPPPAAPARKWRGSDKPYFRNNVWFRPQTDFRAANLAFGYDRALARHFTIGADLEYLMQQPGLWHLQGVAETITFAGWLTRAFNGFYGAASLTVAHQFLAQVPSLSMTAIAPGATLGFRWAFRPGVTVGVGTGLRWTRVVDRNRAICTEAPRCPLTREGAAALLFLDIGYAFGRGRRRARGAGDNAAGGGHRRVTNRDK